MKALIALAFLITALPAWSDSGDETLKFYLSKSDLVVAGKMVSAPVAVFHEDGVPNYLCDFRVEEVLKGDAQLKDQVIKITIKRFEKHAKDAHPLIKKDGECILFLKSSAPDVPAWVTADFWFGVQHPSPWMARSLKRLVGEE